METVLSATVQESTMSSLHPFSFLTLWLGQSNCKLKAEAILALEIIFCTVSFHLFCCILQLINVLTITINNAMTTGRVPGLAIYTKLKVDRETGARYLCYMEVGIGKLLQFRKWEITILLWTPLWQKFIP
jgi:hypothetical protein